MSAMHPASGPLSPAEMVEESDFQSYGDWIAEQRHFCLHDRPDAEELAMLLVPLTYCPNVSTTLEDSNWEGLLACLTEKDPDGNDYQVCSFGHWVTPYRMVMVKPGSEAHREAERIIAALADYPVLDDEDFSEREYAEQLEALKDSIRSLTIEDDGSEVDAEQLAGAMFSDMWESDQGALEKVTRAGGGAITDSERDACLERLGYVQCDDDTWRPIGETEPTE